MSKDSLLNRRDMPIFWKRVPCGSDLEWDKREQEGRKEGWIWFGLERNPFS